MAEINLARGQFASEVDTTWTQESYLLGKVSTKYENIAGSVKSFTVLSPLTVPLVDYTRSGDSRFGKMSEVEDEIQTLEMSKDRSFTKSLDRGNQSDQMHLKSAGAFAKQQMMEQVIPEQDEWGFKRFAFEAGTSLVQAQVDKNNIMGFVLVGRAAMNNAKVPLENRYMYIGTTNCNFVRLSPQFQALDGIGSKVVEKGLIGMLYNFKVIEMPDEYLPTGVQFLLMHKDAGIMPKKIQMLRILTEQKGIDGSVVEGRFYYDAFVLAKKAGGIFTSVLTANKVATPVITPTGASHAVGAVSGVTFKYTLDGSDPRYSATAVTYTGEVTLTDGQTIIVAGFADADNKCISNTATATYTA